MRVSTEKCLFEWQIFSVRCELITRVKFSAHQREKEFIRVGIFTRVASTAGHLQQCVKLSFDTGECEQRGAAQSGSGRWMFLCAQMRFLTRIILKPNCNKWGCHAANAQHFVGGTSVRAEPQEWSWYFIMHLNFASVYKKCISPSLRTLPWFAESSWQRVAKIT